MGPWGPKPSQASPAPRGSAILRVQSLGSRDFQQRPGAVARSQAQPHRHADGLCCPEGNKARKHEKPQDGVFANRGWGVHGGPHITQTPFSKVQAERFRCHDVCHLLSESSTKMKCRGREGHSNCGGTVAMIGLSDFFQSFFRFFVLNVFI